MTLPSLAQLYEVTDATWPAAASDLQAGFVIRDGQGGGKRVSAATLAAPLHKADVAQAETAMRALGQTPLFMIRDGEQQLDKDLEARGYQVIDPVNLYAARATDLAQEIPPRTIAIPAWEPLRIMEEIWATGGIGAARINVMRRAKGAKTGLISRLHDHPAGASFLAMHGGISMLHALEVKPEYRRQGLGRWVMRRAGFWTLQQGGEHVSVICTCANHAANALYTGLGMELIGCYHYRILPE